MFVEELLNLHRGQGQDIVWRDTQKVPSEKEYYSMVLDKTGGLFRWPSHPALGMTFIAAMASSVRT